jgi:hypothetical protein
MKECLGLHTIYQLTQHVGLKAARFSEKKGFCGMDYIFPGFKGPIVQRVSMLEAGKGFTGTTGFPRYHRGNVSSRVPAY